MSKSSTSTTSLWSAEGAGFKLGREPLRIWRPRAPSAAFGDDDGDGVADDLDAFPLDDSESVDSDGDGFGDNIDPDDDHDGGRRRMNFIRT